MSPVARGWTITLIIVLLGIFGIVFGLRSCLSRYDEREAIPRILYFKNDSSSVLFSLVKYTKVNSYSNKGGLTRRTVTDYYYVQSNSAVTGEKIKSRKIASEVKNFPETILGSEGSNAWIFINELMAFNAFTLETVADIKMIEAKNPFLKGMMPKESQYYQYNDSAKGIVFKANDGAEWLIHSNTLIATPYVAHVESDDITSAQRMALELQKRLKDLTASSLNFNQLKVNQDTFHHQWLGLYSKKEIETINSTISFTPQYSEGERRQFYSATYETRQYTGFGFNKPTLLPASANTFYLDGGFLADKETGNALLFNAPAGYLIIHKKVIGPDGEVIITRIDTEGKSLWELNTKLSKWVDYKVAGNTLFIFGNDNSEIGPYNCSILMIVDCTSGTVKVYDYFKDEIRK